MDGSIIAGIITALCGGVAAIISAFALLRRASTATTHAKNALRGLWYWIEAKKPPIVGEIPPRLLRDVQRALADESEQNDQGATVLKHVDPRLIADVNAAQAAEKEAS